MARCKGSAGHKVATGADAERLRILSAERDGSPWRRWAAILDDDRPLTPTGALAGISGIADETHGLAVTFRVTPEGRAATTQTIRSMVATPTASYLGSIVRVVSVPGARQGARQRQDLEVQLRCAKRSPEDVVIRLAVTNRGMAAATANLTIRLGAVDDRWIADTAGQPTFTAVDEIGLLAASLGDAGTWWLALADDAEGDTAAADGIETTVAGSGAQFRARLGLQPGETRTLCLRLSRGDVPQPPVGLDAEAALGTRTRQASAFLATLAPNAGEALARLFWGPWPTDGAVVDHVFEALGVAVVDPVAAQRRLGSVIEQSARRSGASTEPPVVAWAALRIHELVVSATGSRDHDFLERVFQTLLEDYSRWVDRLDPADRNPLQGGLLGLDGSGSTAASAAWMACYSVWMLSLAVELARDDPNYQDVAVTFLDTTLAMVSALDDMGGSGLGMWDENDGWYHDVTRTDDGEVARLAGRSLIGLVPLLAVAVIPREALGRLPEVAVRLGWSLRHDMDLEGTVVRAPRHHGTRGDMVVSLVPAYRRVRVLARIDHGHPDIPVPMTCLLLDVLDRLRPFDGGDTREAAHLRSFLWKRLAHDSSVWAVLLAGAMRRSS